MGSRTTPEKSNLDNHVAWPKIKKETPDNEIKEFAETAMNELLGWYGYEKIARDDTTLLQGLPAARLTKKRLRKQPSEPTSDVDTSEDDIPRTNTPSQQKHTSADVASTNDSCGWCNKVLPADSCQTLTSASGSFCSELCFAQSRRASFKKNKTCDWCRHVRHTVSYVDFQDGASQLQFCSDKCLNQYKMHIFCREAQAHLEIYPHLHSVGDSSVQQGLITPDLWLRNCRSPSNEPRTPSSCSPPNSLSNNANENELQNKHIQQTSPLPLITVAHPSKLMYNNQHEKKSGEEPCLENNIKIVTNNKNRKRRNSQCTSTITSTVNQQKDNNCVAQDLRIQHNTSPPNLVPAHSGSEERFGIIPNNPPESFNTDSYKNQPNICTSNPVDSNGLPPYMLFGHRQPQFFSPNPRLFVPNVNMFPPPPHLFTTAPRPPPPLPVSPIVPPVTILVPYPVILPIPLPIPLPVPLMDFLKAAMASSAKSQNKTSEPQESNTSSPHRMNNDSPSPQVSSPVETTVKSNENEPPVENESEKTSDANTFGNIDSIPSPMRPLRKRKRIITKENNKEVNCKTRKPKYLST